MAGYLHTREKRSFYRIEARREHRWPPYLREQTVNLRSFAVTKPHARCVRRGKSASKIGSFRNLVFRKNSLSVSVGERKMIRRLPVC